MANVNLIIDLGSSYTTIYKEGEGIVLHEPTMVLITGDENAYRITDYGLDAYNKIGSLPDGYKLLFPVQEGAIIYKRATKNLLERFIKKVVVRNDYFFKPKVRAFINVPCGCSAEERALFEEVLIASDIDEVFMVESPVFAAFGCGVPMSETTELIVDIGGGLTDVALVTNLGIERGASYGLGGIAVDNGIIEGLESSISLHVGLLTAEKLKKEIGSLYENESNSVTVYGKNTVSGNPKQALVTTKHIRSMIEYYYGKIADLIISFMKELPDETLKRIEENGVIISGGGAAIRGLDTFFRKRLKTTVIIADKAEYAAVTGGARLLADPERLNKILKIM